MNPHTTPPWDRSRSRRLFDDRGSVSTELAVIMPAFFAGFLMLVFFAGQVAQAENDVRAAAHEAARAATLAGDASTAAATAREVAAANLRDSGLACASGPSVTVDTSRFGPGGTVTVTVRCVADHSDVTSVGVPGSKTYAAQAVEVIDVYRSGNAP